MAGRGCSKYFLVFLNVLIFLVGGVLFGAGLMLKLDSGWLESEVVTLFNNIQYNNIPLGIVSEAICYIMMAGGGLIIIAAILGLVGAWRGIKGCLIVYIVVIVFMIMIQAVLIGLWMALRGRSGEWLKGQMLDQLKDYNGPTATDDVSAGWNILFMKAQCCGVNDQFKSGGTNSDFTEVPTTWTSGTDKVPATCCQGVDSGSITQYENSAVCTNTPKNFYTEGCYDRVYGYINTYSLIVIISCGAIVIAQIMAIVASCVVMDKAKNKVSDSNTRPPPYVAINKFMQSRRTAAVTPPGNQKYNNMTDQRP